MAVWVQERRRGWVVGRNVDMAMMPRGHARSKRAAGD